MNPSGTMIFAWKGNPATTMPTNRSGPAASDPLKSSFQDIPEAFRIRRTNLTTETPSSRAEPALGVQQEPP
eukprot:61994-Pyramimonas_sp.AAC.1